MVEVGRIVQLTENTPAQQAKYIIDNFPKSVVPTLLEYGKDSKPTVAAWFVDHPGAEVQCEQYMKAKRLEVVLEYLRVHFDFPFQETALRKHARRQGWVD